MKVFTQSICQVSAMYKLYNINQVVFPIDLEFSLDKNDIAYAIHTLIENIPENLFTAFEHHMEPSSDHPKDTQTLIPFLTNLKESFLVSSKYTAADDGYDSESNYRYIEDEIPNQVEIIFYGTLLKKQSKKWKSLEKKVMN